MMSLKIGKSLDNVYFLQDFCQGQFSKHFSNPRLESSLYRLWAVPSFQYPLYIYINTPISKYFDPLTCLDFHPGCPTNCTRSSITHFPLNSEPLPEAMRQK